MMNYFAVALAFVVAASAQTYPPSWIAATGTQPEHVGIWTGRDAADVPPNPYKPEAGWGANLRAHAIDATTTEAPVTATVPQTKRTPVTRLQTYTSRKTTTTIPKKVTVVPQKKTTDAPVVVKARELPLNPFVNGNNN